MAGGVALDGSQVVSGLDSHYSWCLSLLEQLYNKILSVGQLMNGGVHVSGMGSRPRCSQTECQVQTYFLV